MHNLKHHWDSLFVALGDVAFCSYAWPVLEHDLKILLGWIIGIGTAGFVMFRFGFWLLKFLAAWRNRRNDKFFKGEDDGE